MAKRTGKQIRDDDGQIVAIAGKASNGDGSVFYDQSRGGRWRATYVDATGKRRSVSARTRAEATARRDEKVAEVAVGATVGATGVLGATPTVADLCDWWITYAMDVRPSTENTYRRHVAAIVEHLGDLPVDALDVGRVREFLSTLADECAPDTVRNIRARLRQIAEAGVDLGYLTTNPVAKVSAPKSRAVRGSRGPKRILTPDETHRLVAACAQHRLGAAVAILFLLGNRSSEVLGLAWGDIDLDAGTATVRRGSTFVQGIGQHLDEPKTTSTGGVHHLPPTVVALLRARRHLQNVERLEAGPAWVSTIYDDEVIDPVFTTATGSLVLSQTLYKAVRDCCAIAEVDPKGVGTHTGRRSVVTALYGAGLSIDDVARHVGHGSTATTQGYVQSLGTRPERTAEVAARLLDPGVV